MKQSKKLLCVLLSMLIMMTALTVGASAYKTAYLYPEGYDSINDPYWNKDQASTAFLDYIDDFLAGANVHESYAGIDIEIYSLDSTFDTLKGIREGAIWGLRGLCGDIADLDLSIPKNSSIRRTSTTMSDNEFFFYVLSFFASNADPLYKIADNTLDLGVIGWFLDIGDMIKSNMPTIDLNDLHGSINGILYETLNGSRDGFDASTARLDDILQTFVNSNCVTVICNMFADAETGENTVASFLGLPLNADGTINGNFGLLDLCPSLSADKIDITKVSLYELVENLVGALVDDLIVPLAGGLLMDLLKIDPENPDDPNMAYVDMVISLFLTADYVGLPEDASADEIMTAFMTMKGVENPENPKPLDKLNVGIEYILKEGITQYIYFEEDGQGGKYLTLAPSLAGQITNLIKTVVPLLPTFWDDAPVLSQEELDAFNAMGDEETFAYTVQIILSAVTDDIVFPTNCKTIKELATYTLIGIAEDYCPNIDFEAKIASGEIVPNSDDCLDVAAVLLRYYMVGTVNIIVPDEEPTFEELLNYLMDYAIDLIGGLFNVYPNEGDKETYADNPWYKIYMTVCQWLPLQTMFYGTEDSWMGLRELIMDRILNNILDFNLQGILSLIGKRLDSGMAKPFSQMVCDLLARIVNGLFDLAPEMSTDVTDNAQQKALIIPYGYSMVDMLITNVNSEGAYNGTGLKNTVKMLLTYLPNIADGDDALLRNSLPLVCSLIGILDKDNNSYIKTLYRKNSSAGMSYSIKQLKELYNEKAFIVDETKNYYDDSYVYYEMVDYAPWAYNEYEDIVDDAKKIIDQYDAAKADPDNNTFPSRSDITYAYFALDNYYDVLISNQTLTSDYQFSKVYNSVLAANYTNVNDDGSQKYTDRTWKAYEHALAFAQQVRAEYDSYASKGVLSDYQQSKVNMAKNKLRAAVNNLKAYCGLADYTELDTNVERVVYASESPSAFTMESVMEVLKAYDAALKLDRDYDIDDQRIVDMYSDALDEALANLQVGAYIQLENTVDDTKQYIDYNTGFIFGLPENFASQEKIDEWGSFSDYFYDYGYQENGEDLEIASTANGNGTGSKIKIIGYDDSGRNVVLRDYTVVIFGDVNGDAFVDAQDAVIMRAYASFALDSEFAPDSVVFAGDVDYNNILGIGDAKMIEKAGLKKSGSEINQSPEQFMQDEYTFMSIYEANFK
ncbi:MAG: hypothetical protein PUB20_03280 [Clostridia bacterium]|nr:hypothetical protein [Clostridia bacterium]